MLRLREEANQTYRFIENILYKLKEKLEILHTDFGWGCVCSKLSKRQHLFDKLRTGRCSLLFSCFALLPPPPHFFWRDMHSCLWWSAHFPSEESARVAFKFLLLVLSSFLICCDRNRNFDFDCDLEFVFGRVGGELFTERWSPLHGSLQDQFSD